MKTSANALTVDLAIVLLAFGLTSCVEPRPSSDVSQEEDHEHGGGAAVTIWTENVELFFEYPPMVAGGAGEPWAIHLTFLEDFQPVRKGKLTLRFVGPDQKEYASVAETPARDGIFTPAPSLPNEEAYQLTMTLESPRGEEEIPVGEIRVFGSSAELPHAEDAPAAGISFGITFLKEQQWTTPFATAPAIERELKRSISANGEIVPVPNAVARVTAPVEGIVRAKHNLGAPIPGDWVEAGERIAVLSPVPEENAYAALKAKVERLEREVERAERLSAVEAIPERRLVEARHDLEVSRAALEAVGDVDGEGYELTLTAPINGPLTGAPQRGRPRRGVRPSRWRELRAACACARALRRRVDPGDGRYPFWRERVVTEGAYQVRLASLNASEIADHGHPH